MIDIQDRLRNRGALNLFDGKSVSRETPKELDPVYKTLRNAFKAWENTCKKEPK